MSRGGSSRQFSLPLIDEGVTPDSPATECKFLTWAQTGKLSLWTKCEPSFCSLIIISCKLTKSLKNAYFAVRHLHLHAAVFKVDISHMTGILERNIPFLSYVVQYNKSSLKQSITTVMSTVLKTLSLASSQKLNVKYSPMLDSNQMNRRAAKSGLVLCCVETASVP